MDRVLQATARYLDFILRAVEATEGFRTGDVHVQNSR